MMTCRKMEMEAQSTDNGAGSGQLEEMPGTYPHFALAILLLYGMNTGLSKFTHAANIQFPSALIGTSSKLVTSRRFQSPDLCVVLLSSRRLCYTLGMFVQNIDKHLRHGVMYLSSQVLYLVL